MKKNMFLKATASLFLIAILAVSILPVSIATSSNAASGNANSAKREVFNLGTEYLLYEKVGVTITQIFYEEDSTENGIQIQVRDLSSVVDEVPDEYYLEENDFTTLEGVRFGVIKVGEASAVVEHSVNTPQVVQAGSRLVAQKGMTYYLVNDVSIRVSEIKYEEGNSDNYASFYLKKETSATDSLGIKYTLRDGQEDDFSEGVHIKFLKVGQNSVLIQFYTNIQETDPPVIKNDDVSFVYLNDKFAASKDVLYVLKPYLFVEIVDIEVGGDEARATIKVAQYSDYSDYSKSLDTGKNARSLQLSTEKPVDYLSYRISLLESFDEEEVVLYVTTITSDDVGANDVAPGNGYGYEYVCAPGCREVEEGCLCPKIKVLRDPSGYRIESSDGAPVVAESIAIEPGSDSITARVEGDGDVDIGVDDLKDGLEVEVGQNGQKIRIKTNQDDLSTSFADQEVYAKTRETIRITEKELAVDTPNGRKAIVVLPSVASETAKEVIAAKNAELELKEEGGVVMYEYNARQKYRIIGLIPAEADVSADIDATTGEIISTDMPWYAAISSRAD